MFTFQYLIYLERISQVDINSNLSESQCQQFMTVISLHCVDTFFAVELPIQKPNMATPPVVHQPINAKHGYETEGRQKTLLIQNNNAMLDHLF